MSRFLPVLLVLLLGTCRDAPPLTDTEARVLGMYLARFGSAQAMYQIDHGVYASTADAVQAVPREMGYEDAVIEVVVADSLRWGGIIYRAGDPSQGCALWGGNAWFENEDIPTSGLIYPPWVGDTLRTPGGRPAATATEVVCDYDEGG